MLLFVSLGLWISAASLAVKSQELENNPYPCMPSEKNNGYQNFLNKHVRYDAPTNLDQNQWQTFIRQINTCGRPIQSFIPYSEKQRVDGVCSASGGKTFQKNMCISKEEFTFTTVYVNNNCIVTKVTKEKKYLILACDELQGQCQPVHFEPNKNNIGPDDRNLDCETPTFWNHTKVTHPALGLLTLALLSAALTHFIWV